MLKNNKMTNLTINEKLTFVANASQEKKEKKQNLNFENLTIFKK
jgi:hypothetical protein